MEKVQLYQNVSLYLILIGSTLAACGAFGWNYFGKRVTELKGLDQKRSTEITANKILYDIDSNSAKVISHIDLHSEKIINTFNNPVKHDVLKSGRRNYLNEERFEKTFFNLLSQHNQTVQNLAYDGKILGKTAFEWSFNNLNDQVNPNIKSNASRKEYCSNMETAYFYYYLGEKRVMENYYNSLINLLQFVETSDQIDEDKKIFFFSIIYNGMAFFEKINLFYYAALSREKNNIFFRKFEGKYKFLNGVFDAHVCRDPEDDYLLFYSGVYSEADLDEDNPLPR